MAKKRKKQKEIRLQNMLDKDSYNMVLSFYNEAKTNNELTREDFILFKSFLARMVSAQKEYSDDILTENIFTRIPQKSPRWVTPEAYFNVMMQGRTKSQFIKDFNKQFKNKNFSPFNFVYERDYGMLI